MRCGKQKHSFWADALGDMLSYLANRAPGLLRSSQSHITPSRLTCPFILNRAILLKCKQELIMKGLKIISMKMEHLVFRDSVSYLPCALRKVPEAFGVSASKSWYPHYINTEET